MVVYNSILDLIGNTPIVRLNKLPPKGSAELYVKLEYLNPAGSLKDRPALKMIQEAEKAGKLKPGATIVEPTSGNMGIALAMISAVRGYHCILTMPDWMSPKKRELAMAFGAEIVLCPTAVPRNDPRSYYSTAKRIAKEKGAIMLDQYVNPANPLAHYGGTGPEILHDLPKIDAVVIGVGTGGTFTGVARFLKKKSKARIVMADPVGSVLGGGEAKQFFIEGIGQLYIPENAEVSLADEVVKVSEKDAMRTARELARSEGILAGPSSGAVAFAALKLAERLGKGKIVVALLPDSGERYSYLYDGPGVVERRGLATQLIHAGRDEIESYANAISFPIFQTSNFRFESLEQARSLFAEGAKQGKKKRVFAYTRGSNPTVRLLERKLAALEGGEDAVAFGSGMAAITALALATLKKGDHAAVSDVTYGETNILFSKVLPSLGIETDFIDTSDVAAVKRAMKKNTRLIFIETPMNPTMRLSDISAISKIKGEAILAVDNSFATPILQQPLESGADATIHSLSKFLSGHGDVIGGAVIANGQLIEKVRQQLYTIGGVLDPFAAWLVLRGLPTLALRVQAQCRNAYAIARFLHSHPKVKSVAYPGLEDFPQTPLRRTQMRGGGSLLSFELHGGVKAGEKLINSLKLFSLAVSFGGVESLIQLPAAMTHSHIEKSHRKKTNIEELIRISAGIEDADDLIADLKQALEGI